MSAIHFCQNPVISLYLPQCLYFHVSLSLIRSFPLMVHGLQLCQPGKIIIRKEIVTWPSGSHILKSTLPLLNNISASWTLSFSSPEHTAKSANFMLPRKPTLDTIGVYFHCLFHSLPPALLFQPRETETIPVFGGCLCFKRQGIIERSVFSMRRKQKHNGPGLQQKEWKVD